MTAKTAPDSPAFRLRPGSISAEGGASSMLRVARATAAMRSAPVLQPARAPRQLTFDFFRASR